MKKGLIIALLLLPTVVFAQDDTVTKADFNKAESRLIAIEDQVTQINNRLGMLTGPEKPTAEYPKELYVLLSLNVLLLFVVIILIIYLRGRYAAHSKFKAELSEHIHPAPKELTDYVKAELKKKKTLSAIRLDLADKGWSPSIIEHAIHAAKER